MRRIILLGITAGTRIMGRAQRRCWRRSGRSRSRSRGTLGRRSSRRSSAKRQRRLQEFDCARIGITGVRTRAHPLAGGAPDDVPAGGPIALSMRAHTPSRWISPSTMTCEVRVVRGRSCMLCRTRARVRCCRSRTASTWRSRTIPACWRRCAPTKAMCSRRRSLWDSSCATVPPSQSHQAATASARGVDGLALTIALQRAERA
jgi:hypothetical protein